MAQVTMEEGKTAHIFEAYDRSEFGTGNCNNTAG